MRAANARLSRIEKKLGQRGGLLVVVRAGRSDEEVEAVLGEAGIDRANPAHLIVALRTLYEGRDGGLATDQPKAQILYIQPKR